jgi:hypothetical protein
MLVQILLTRHVPAFVGSFDIMPATPQVCVLCNNGVFYVYNSDAIIISSLNSLVIAHFTKHRKPLRS